MMTVITDSKRAISTLTTPETLSASPDWLTEVAPQALDALGITDHCELFASGIDGETPEERVARLAAAADIFDHARDAVGIDGFLIEPLVDHEDGLAAGVDAAVTEISARVTAWVEEAAA